MIQDGLRPSGVLIFESFTGGVMPLNNASWGSVVDSVGDVRDQCPLSATRKGLDGRTTLGHVDDYWIGYGEGGPDPWQSAGVTEHTKGGCVADYMGTSQWIIPQYNGYPDGSTSVVWYTDNSKLPCAASSNIRADPRGDLGLKRFFESRGYTPSERYTQQTDTVIVGGFSFEDFKRKIDIGYPVILSIRGAFGHSVVGFGYDNKTQTVYLKDTWDHGTHTMKWNGSYYDMSIKSVSVVKLAYNYIPRENPSSVGPPIYQFLLKTK